MSANAEYVVEVAAEMTGDETLAELDELSSELLGAGKNADFFQSAIQTVSRDLREASAAAKQANAALADGEDTYRKLEAEAAQTAKTVEKLGLKGDTMSRAYLEAARKSDIATTALAKQAGTLKELEAAATGATAREQKLQATLAGVTKLSGHVDKTIADQAKEWRVLSGVLRDLPGPLGKLGASFAAGEAAEAKFAARFGEDAGLAVKLGVGVAGVTAAVLALAAATAYGTVKVATWAVGLADANRNAELAVEAIQAMHPELEALGGTIASVSKQTGMHSDELNELAVNLEEAGVKSDKLADSLRVAALAESALGKGAAGDYESLIKSATEAQKAVDEAAKKSGGAVSKELTDKLLAANDAVSDFEHNATTKLGGIVARQMQGLSAQSQRLESNISDIFGGLDIDPVLSGLAKIVGLFDKESASGRAIKLLFESVFQPLIDQADDAATAVEAFVLGVEIGAVKLYIALKPTIKAVKEFLGIDDDSLSINFKTLTEVGEELAPVFLLVAGVVGGVLLVAFGAIAAIIAAQIAVWYALVKAVQFVWDMIKTFAGELYDIGAEIVGAIEEPFKAVAAFLSGEIDLAELGRRLVMNLVNTVGNLSGLVLHTFISLITAPIDYIFGLDLTDAGKNLIMGFVHGITGSVGAVVSAVSSAMSSAITAAKSVLGIHSPSKVFAGIADNTTDGYTNTLEDNTADVQDATANMLGVGPANDNALDPAEELKQAQLSGDADAVSRLQGMSSSADAGAPKQAPAPDAGGGSGGKGASFGPGATFNFYGLADAKDALGAFGEMLDAAVEGDTAKLGAALAKGKAAA